MESLPEDAVIATSIDDFKRGLDRPIMEDRSISGFQPW